MSWRRLGDLVLACLVASGMWGIAIWIWPLFGPVGIVIVILLVVVGANAIEFARSLLRNRASARKRSVGDH